MSNVIIEEWMETRISNRLNCRMGRDYKKKNQRIKVKVTEQKTRVKLREDLLGGLTVNYVHKLYINYWTNHWPWEVVPTANAYSCDT